MFAGFIVAFAVARLLDRFDPLFARNSEPRGIIGAAVVILAVGLYDDIKGSLPPAKVTAIVLAGLILVQYGVTMYYFRIPFVDDILLSTDWVPLITVLWLLGMTQAINLIDGLDGLAAGIVAIAAGSFFLYAQKLSDLGLLASPNFGPLVAIIAVGMCVGFLPHNFNPARIIMGDSGALLLGLMMAVSTSVVGGRSDPSGEGYVGQTYFFLAPLVIPLLILGVPILDLVYAVIRRASRRQALDVADKGHLHHRLMNLGHGHRRSVLILWAWTAGALGIRPLPGAHQREPVVPAVRDGGDRHRLVHGVPPERAATTPGQRTCSVLTTAAVASAPDATLASDGRSV